MGRSEGPEVAIAFAPGHLTGFFAPDLAARDPRGRGSVGAGLVLDRGVWAEARWTPGGRRRRSVSDRPRRPLPISREVAVRLAADRPGDLEVRLDHELPIGQGLGMSAAGAVATGLAVAAVLGLPEPRAWEVAHLADLTLQGGLGGVAALGGGGLERRTRAGVPPYGEVRHYPAGGEVFLVPVGPPVPSPSVLGNARSMRRIDRAGRAALRRFARRPTLPTFLAESERFTDAVRVAADRDLRDRLAELRGAGWAAAQAMFGRLVFAVAPPGKPPPEPPRGAVRVAIGGAGAGRRPGPMPTRVARGGAPRAASQAF